MPWLIGYALAFWAAHHVAAEWGGNGYYSLLYPAAGFRMALLWRRGPRLLVGIIVAELLVQLATGIIDPTSPGWAIAVTGVIRPPLAYGLVVLLVRHLANRAQTSLSVAPMPLGLASVGAPVAAALFALPWSLLRPDLTGVTGLREIVASLTGFVVGDLLGVLLLTPPLLWLADLASGGAARPARPRIAAMAEAVLVLAASFASEAMLATIGLGTPHTPVLLAVAWIGLRFGRTASWLAIVAVAAVILPQTAMPMRADARLALHMSLASILVVGYLAGSFADAQARARGDLQRRDRLLFQAERLKTLRAMSVAVIHEISQPLSTLAIEARHLHEITVSADLEIASTAALIDRKAAALSTLVRRLRRFGGRIVDEPTPLPLATLIETVAALAHPEAKSRNVRLTIEPVDPDLVVLAQEVELAQAIVNLVRNAVQACGGGEVTVVATRSGAVGIGASGDSNEARITVANRYRADRAQQPGMGVGVLVARAIVEAHGGTLTRTSDAAGMMRATISLPLLGEPE
ncbi:ATP-binding protein [Sphingomonas sp. 4RDLI-65]|uniref:ATP-binding protein n=1 Tax=Sphingomonas sp. 4RDLI-65 TaxID=3111641 RepID=UPI003C13DDEC